MTLTYPEFHSHIDSLAKQLRQVPYIPLYIVSQEEGLIAASYLARRFNYYPTVVDIKSWSFSLVPGNVLLLSTTSGQEELKMYEALRVMVGNHPSTHLLTAAVVECSFQVDFSAIQLPEEPGMPWQL